MYDTDDLTYGRMLTAFVKQPANTVIVDDTDRFIEEFKGKYEDVRSLTQTIHKGDLRIKVLSLIGSYVEDFNPPPPPASDMQWKVSNLEVKELEAGVYAILRIEYTAQKDALDEFLTDWNIQWKQQTINVLGYCANALHDDKEAGAQSAPDTETTMASHIKTFLDGNRKIPALSANFLYLTYGTKFLQLNPRETALASKVLEGKEFITFHTPVVTRVDQSGTLSSNYTTDCPFDDIGYNLDTIDNPEIYVELSPPIGSTGSDTWQFKKTLDDVQLHFTDKSMTNHYWTRTRKWEGAVSWDVNFYGSPGQQWKTSRWAIGKF